MARLLVFDTHPIQYRSPVFRALLRENPGLEVYFFNARFEGDKWWFSERRPAEERAPGEGLTAGYPNRTLGLSGLSLAAKWKKLNDILAGEKPDAIVVYGYYLPEHWLLRLASARRKIPLVFVGETFTDPSSLWRSVLRRLALAYFFRGVSRFVAIGEKSAAFYRSFGIPAEKIVRGRYCVDVSFFERPEAESLRLRDEWRDRMGIARDAFVLLFVGRLVDRKRPVDALTLHRNLSDPSLQLVFAGSGPLEEKLKGPGVHVLGFVEQRHLAELYHSADALIVPSEFETWGLVVNEAFAAGKPALVTETCGAAGDLVLPGKTGFVFSVGNLEEAGRHLTKLMSDRAAAARMGRFAHQRVSALYGTERFAGSLLEASGLREVSGGSSRRQEDPDSGPKFRPAYEY